MAELRGRRRSTNIRDLRDPAAAAAYEQAFIKQIETDARKSAARTMLQVFKQDERMESVAAHQKGEALGIQADVMGAVDAERRQRLVKALAQ